MFSTVQLYFHSLRYLKPLQCFGRFWHRYYRPAKPADAALPLRHCARSFYGSQRKSAMIAANEFVFFNEQHTLHTAGDWNSPTRPLLWRYGVHMFDDLTASAAADRLHSHRELITRWIAENPPVKGLGWEAYTISRRSVNWIRCHLNTQALDAAAQRSLAQQLRYLRQRVEYHVLGNHVLANAKALIFAGCFFDSAESDQWLRRGLVILSSEMAEQILPDAGHFERSPMYHAILVEDLLDLIQLARCYPDVIPPGMVAYWRELTRDMLVWLRNMTHPDGGLAFFNDATLGSAPDLLSLISYAERLDISLTDPDGCSALMLDSGYARFQSSDAVLLADVGPIGPDYLPDHAHADTLSFELSLFRQRVFVNQGIDRYSEDAERVRQRGTAAHNTVVVDGQNSSEVWSGFRVARRARPFDFFADILNDPLTLRCSHDGYRRLRGNVVHTRQWQLTEGALCVTDTLTGQWQQAFASLHLHPQVTLLAADTQSCTLEVAGKTVTLTVQGATLQVLDGSYHPGFALSEQCISLRLMMRGDSLVTRVEWGVAAV